MEPYDPSAALTNDVTVHRAEGVLAALLDVSILDAAVSLDLKAQFRGLSLEATAQQVLDGGAVSLHPGGISTTGRSRSFVSTWTARPALSTRRRPEASGLRQQSGGASHLVTRHGFGPD
jgi:hypothetical protein